MCNEKSGDRPEEYKKRLVSKPGAALEVWAIELTPEQRAKLTVPEGCFEKMGIQMKERRQTWYNRIFCAFGWHWPQKSMIFVDGKYVEVPRKTRIAVCCSRDYDKDGNCDFHAPRLRCDSCEKWLSKDN